MAHPKADVVRGVIEAVGKRDFETVAAMIATGAVYHVSGHGPVAGVYRGRDEVMGFARKQTALTNDTLEITEIHDIIASDDHVVAMLRLRAQKDNHVFDWGRVIVYHVDGEQITEAWIVDGDQAGLDRFLST